MNNIDLPFVQDLYMSPSVQQCESCSHSNGTHCPVESRRKFALHWHRKMLHKLLAESNFSHICR